MKWVNHKVITFGIIFLLTHDFVKSFISMTGSIIPDAVEGYNYGSEQWKTRHRKLSHWLLGYVLLLGGLIGYSLFMQKGIFIWNIKYNDLISNIVRGDIENTVLFVSIFLILGSVLHILEDSISGKVPFVSPKQRTFGAKLIPTGSFYEYMLAWTVFTVALLITPLHKP